jgi:hypothetical protein
MVMVPLVEAVMERLRSAMSLSHAPSDTGSGPRATHPLPADDASHPLHRRHRNSPPTPELKAVPLAHISADTAAAVGDEETGGGGGSGHLLPEIREIEVTVVPASEADLARLLEEFHSGILLAVSYCSALGGISTCALLFLAFDLTLTDRTGRSARVPTWCCCRCYG